MALSAELKSLMHSVCAIGCLRVPAEEYARNPTEDGFHIQGTGFLVRSSTVLTNRHVLMRLLQFQQKHGFSDDRLFLQFNYPSPTGAQQGWCRFKKWGAAQGDPWDLALIDFKRRAEPEFGQVQPVKMADTALADVGDEVGAVGFPFGSDLLAREFDGVKRLYRFGPVFQRGHVSAIAPFETSKQMERLLLDIRTYDGMSGSPVFRLADGVVVGIHDRGTGGAVTAFALPLHRNGVDALLAGHDQTIVGGPPAPVEAGYPTRGAS